MPSSNSNQWNFPLEQLPPILFEILQELVEERENSGVETTPDETSDVIESLFLHLGRIWLFELWNATENGGLDLGNIDVLSVLLDSRDTYLNSRLTIGRWWSIQKNLHYSNSIAACTKGMETIDWGSGGSVQN